MSKNDFHRFFLKSPIFEKLLKVFKNSISDDYGRLEKNVATFLS